MAEIGSVIRSNQNQNKEYDNLCKNKALLIVVVPKKHTHISSDPERQLVDRGIPFTGFPSFHFFRGKFLFRSTVPKGDDVRSSLEKTGKQ